jgi:hypothetical protein
MMSGVSPFEFLILPNVTSTAATTRSSSRPAACAGHTCGTIIKERISIAKSEPGMLRVEMTAIDNSLTRPWTVLKTFKPVRQRQK